MQVEKDDDCIAVATRDTTIAAKKEGGRQSLSDWYQRPEVGSDDSDNASNDGREGGLEQGNLACSDVEDMRPASSKAAQTPRRKRRSLGDWWLANERPPSNWTPDTKVMYLGDDWNELAREWQHDAQYGSTPTRPGYETEARAEAPQRRRRRHSLHITRAPIEAVPASSSAAPAAETDEQESQAYVLHLFSEPETDSEEQLNDGLFMQTSRPTAKALPTSPSKRSAGTATSTTLEPKTLEVHLISQPHCDSDEPKKSRRRHSLQMTRETAEALAEVLPESSSSRCSAKATVDQSHQFQEQDGEKLATLDDFLAPEKLEDFLQRPAAQSMLDDEERSPALTSLWQAIVEMITDAKSAAYDLTLYVLDPGRNDLVCLPTPDLVSYRRDNPEQTSTR